MPFGPFDPFPGMVATFAIDDLRGRPDVDCHGGSADPKPRPFICYASDPDEGVSYWTPLTTQNPRGKRLPLDPSWFSPSNAPLRARENYLNDGGHAYVGSDEVGL